MTNAPAIRTLASALLFFEVAWQFSICKSFKLCYNLNTETQVPRRLALTTWKQTGERCATTGPLKIVGRS